MEDKLTDATFNVTKLERKTKQLEEENHELQEQLNDDTSSREMIQFKSTKEKELAELRENWLTAKEKMDAQQQNLLREITNLKEKLEKEEVNSVNLKKKYKKMENIEKQLKTQIEESQNEYAKLEKLNKKKQEKEIKDLKIQAMEFNELKNPNRVGASKEKVDAFQEQIKELTTKFETEKSLKVNLEKEKKTYQLAVEEVKAQMEDLTANAEKIQKANKKLKEEMESMLDEIDEERALKEELEGIKYNLGLQIEDLNREKVQLINEKSKTEDHCRKTDAEVKQLKSELQTEKKYKCSITKTTKKNYKVNSKNFRFVMKMNIHKWFKQKKQKEKLKVK